MKHETGDSSRNDECDQAVDGATPRQYNLPQHNTLYTSQVYWNNRFAKEKEYEWLMSYAQLAPQLKQLDVFRRCPGDTRILVVGCGNSPFSAALYDDGYPHVVNLDYSSTVIAHMQGQHQRQRPQMQWVVGDMTNMTFAPDSFDVVIDKAAMDALLSHEEDIWCPNNASVQAAHAMCSDVSRVLTADGVFVSLSLVQPHFRTTYLRGEHHQQRLSSKVATRAESPRRASSKGYSTEYGWTVSWEHAGAAEHGNGGAFGYYLYIMRKQRYDV